jgi:hypothetical protein
MTGERRSTSPGTALLLTAIAIAAAWGVLHAAGWRNYTGVFCVGLTAPGQAPALVKAVLYAGVHLLLVLAAPVLALAGALLLVLERLGNGAPRTD